MSISDRHFIERHGKRYVLYAGLLEEAHSQGLFSIETELLQVPNSANGEVAIVRAVVRTEEGKFTGIGDASPQNVGKNIAPHIIRMAETRAKARALRDAVNVGVTAFEELGDGEDNEAPAQTPRERNLAVVGKLDKAREAADEVQYRISRETDKDLRLALMSLADSRKEDRAEVMSKFMGFLKEKGVPGIAQLSEKQAQEYIQKYRPQVPAQYRSQIPDPKVEGS